jgi:AbiTii
MTLLEDIQNSAIDGKSDLAELLRKCKLLAARLGSKPLEDWLIWESNGYPETAPVPDYRIWRLEVLGNFEGPFGSSIKNAPIPIGMIKFISEETKQQYERWACRQSIGSIQELLRKSDTDYLVVNTGHLAAVIGTKLYKDQMFNCVETWARSGRGHLVEVLNVVRNRILDFALAVEKEAPTAGEIQDETASQQIDSAKVNQIFNLTVFGGAANIVGTATDSLITFNIGTGDFSALEQLLIEKGVSPNDIANLKTALDSEPTPLKPEGFGPKVSSWVGKMIAKAADGSWNIGIGAAGNLLAQAIAKYYGL